MELELDCVCQDLSSSLSGQCKHSAVHGFGHPSLAVFLFLVFVIASSNLHDCVTVLHASNAYKRLPYQLATFGHMTCRCTTFSFTTLLQTSVTFPLSFVNMLSHLGNFYAIFRPTILIVSKRAPLQLTIACPYEHDCHIVTSENHMHGYIGSFHGTPWLALVVAVELHMAP